MTFLTVNIKNKTYANGCCAIENLSFSANPGEFIAIVGPSGAGKTTLLNLVAGLDQDMAGVVTFGTAQSLQVEPRCGYLFQESRLMPWLTVQQNLELVLPAKSGLSQVRSLKDWLSLVGLQGCADMFPSQLSGGMQRRVALLRAFIVEPELLFMDEPFQSLDAPTANQLRMLLQDLWKSTSPTVLFVTHNLREALSLANRVLFLSTQPSRVILDIPVHLEQPCTIDDSSVHQFHETLLKKYPTLLEGQT